MKRVMMTAVLALCMASPALAADPVEGIWQTSPDDNGKSGYIQMQLCGVKFCGTLIKAFDKDGKPTKSDNIGKQLVWDMVAQGNGAYGEGKVWSPDRNKTYDSKMQLTGDSLAVSGCILGGFICRNGGTWTRVKK